jgi:peroxidase
LVAGNGSERAAPGNTNMHGFEAIDAAKEAVERECPGVVSCADILVFASRDSVRLTKGKGWRVPSGRRDGRVSLAAEVGQNLPPATFTAPQLIATFAAKNLSAQQMVDLSGSHTIGVTHCVQMRDRIFATIDPTMPKNLLRQMQKLCLTPATPTALPLDRHTPDLFDTQYFKNIVVGRGLMTSDQTLFANLSTRPFVVANLNQHKFFTRYAKAMVAMTNIEPKVGTEGEIRRHCQFVN